WRSADLAADPAATLLQVLTSVLALQTP
ncbi:MAG: hypothetical protein QOG96_4961, partial [Pseudonocardiales bacterium]|nr:hypothetical protein [Pseudonocardiales bacterium]